MRVQFPHYHRQNLLGDILIIYTVHIVAVNLLKDQQQLVPSMAGHGHDAAVLQSAHNIGHNASGHNQNQAPEDKSENSVSVRSRHDYSTSYLQTSIPALRSSSIPSRTLYSMT